MAEDRVVTGYWNWARVVALASCLVGFLGSCSSRTGAEENAADWSVGESELVQGHTRANVAYYRLRPSDTTCSSPLCGGYLVQTLRERDLRCPDGSVAPQCYVAELKFDGALPAGEEYVVRGRLAKARYRGYGTLGVFHAEAVWVTDQTLSPLEDEDFFAVSKMVWQCSKEPCPTARVQRLNTPRWLPVFELDWELAQAACPEQQVAAGVEALEQGDLLVLGKLERDKPFVAERLLVSHVLLTSPAPTCEVDEDAGFNGPTCVSDPDCGLEGWCRETRSGSRTCVPYKAKGEECFWAPDEPWKEERCQIGIEWCESSSSPQRPGICRTACKGICPTGEWCSPSGCAQAGTCLAAIDCWRNDSWGHEGCTGYPTCEPTGGTFGQCTWHCGNPACMDISNHNLGAGECEYLMGYGTYEGACTPLIGCETASDYAPPLFDTLEECQATCETATE